MQLVFGTIACIPLGEQGISLPVASYGHMSMAVSSKSDMFLILSPFVIVLFTPLFQVQVAHDTAVLQYLIFNPAPVWFKLIQKYSFDA